MPHDWPSGVSAGHIIPHCVLCKRRGFVTLLPVSIGDFNRRRLLREDEYVNRFNVWETPVDVGRPRDRSPQFPVANEYWRPLVIIVLYWEFQKYERLLSLLSPDSQIHFLSCYQPLSSYMPLIPMNYGIPKIPTFVNRYKSPWNNRPIMGPAKSIRLLQMWSRSSCSFRLKEQLSSLCAM